MWDEHSLKLFRYGGCSGGDVVVSDEKNEFTEVGSHGLLFHGVESLI
jgi:hypothetical protein